MGKAEVLSVDASMAADLEKLKEYEPALMQGWEKLKSGQEAFTGWVKLPLEYNREEIRRIQETAKRIRKQCDAFVVIGIGGSYLGARAAIEMLGSTFPRNQGSKDFDEIQPPKVYFAGNNLSGTYHYELLEQISEKDICICVISKSGTTAEPNIAFALFKELLLKKYGEAGCRERIYVITDSKKGVLREEVLKQGYESFVVPDDIGGRYSVLSPVGLLPIAVSGIDVLDLLNGAADLAKELAEQAAAGSAGMLAAVRNELYKSGKVIEIFEYYEPKLQFFTEWLKQLFGESEGKQGKGIFPTALQFSTDLHSMGQFLQQGNQIFFETILHVVKPEKDQMVPQSAGNFLGGKSMNAINDATMNAVMQAHRKEGISMIKVDIPALNTYHFGQMVYFFETACALSGCLLGVNPFDQPGVESYKLEMREALAK